MVDFTDRKTHRRLEIVSQLRHKPLSSKELASTLTRRKLAVCAKTVQRDIEDMRAGMRAPIEYDQTEHGYRLTDPEWVYPATRLEGDALFASLFAFRLSEPVLPASLRDVAAAAERIQLAACEPGELPDDLLNTLMQATTSKVLLDDDTFAIILDAWRERRSLTITYTNEKDEVTRRRIDPHALFLCDGAWYLRAYCHRRHRALSFAIHRCLVVKPSAERFQRQDAVLAGLRSGNPFDYEEIRDVTIRCDADKAPIIREREWFPGQQLQDQPDGSLTLHFPAAPEPMLIRWVLAYAPHLTVVEPAQLRRSIWESATCLRDAHAH